MRRRRIRAPESTAVRHSDVGKDELRVGDC